MSHSRRSEDLPRRSSTQLIPGSTTSRKPVIAQATIPSSDAPGPGPRDSSDSLETVASPPSRPVGQSQDINFPCPLLPDPSLYTNHIGDQEPDGTTLEELAHLVRLSKYQERKRANTRIRLQRSLISTALSARLVRCGELAHRNLVDCFRGDDKKIFASLYNAVIDVRRSCEETRRYALLEPDMELLHSPSVSSTDGMDTPTASIAGGGAAVGSIAPFLNDISASARETFLNLLTQIRTNPDYLATRIASLDLPELTALTSFHQGLEAIESVLPYHNRPSGRGTGPSANRNPVQERSAIERLLSFQRHDPLSALIHTCFANSAGPDSAEDKRRSNIWATTCAKLISEQKPGIENILIAVIDAWVAMRDWSGKSNMEWYLMKILEDGAFLLDRAEDQHGTRFNLSDWTSKDQIAAEEFYERATDELFDVIDDEDATGIPEGLIELGNEILKKLDSKYVDSTRKWFVYKWLFSVWLLGVVIHPESYGMMADYHITEYGRQKILKQVALRAQRDVVEMLWTKSPVSTPPKVKAHVDSIIGRFKHSSSRKSKPRLLPARSITSLRETVEVHPYLVISPADLATLVNALFPEKRPQSAQSSSLRSGAPSISAFSIVSQPMSRAFDTASVLSTSAGSMVSEATTSREPLIDEPRHGSPHRYSPPILDQGSQNRPSSYEDDGYRLRLAMHEMTQILGQDVVYGSCHPCAERWAVLFISSDGNTLSTHMTYDPDEDVEEEENSSTSDTEDEDTEDDRPELDKSYHQLRDSILKLVEDFEIPQTPGDGDTKTKTFSNRASSLKKYRSKNRIITAGRTMGSRNPYRKRLESIASSQAGSPPRSSKGKEGLGDEEKLESSPVLVDMLKAASSQSRAQSDFVAAHLYWRTLQQLNMLSSDSLRRNGFATLLNIFSRGPRDSLRRSASAIEEYDAWLIWLKQSQERAEGLIDTMMRRFRALRDKMWYVTDVRNSAPYEHSRNIAVALKTMGMPRKWDSFQRTRNHTHRGPTANYLFRTESQIMDLLAASEDQGGPNKLSDDQAEKTSRWLLQYSVENFCRGEERIHRFCCEVDNCINKLVGDSIVDTPVLWSSELYLRDRRAMEGGRGGRDRESHGWDDAASSVTSDPERRFGSMGRPPITIPRDMRNMSAHNVSQLSFDSGRFSFSRASTVLSDITDSQDYFGVSSPVHTIDSSTTFWSPFQAAIAPSSAASRAQSPTTSVTNLSAVFSQPNHQHLPSQSHHSAGRPGTSASSNETVYQQRISEEKARFLTELRQTLTSLLLSDLGNLVFARGSETDGWFEGLGQECIDRREALRRRAPKPARKSSKAPLKQRAMEKRRSLGSAETSSDKAGSDIQSPGLAPESAGSHGNDSSATSDTVSARTNSQKPHKDTMPEFPFTKAYQRLLRMFCVHPNPYTKLNALFELENLIVASLTSGSRKSRLAWARLEVGSPSSASDDHTVNSSTGRAKPLEEAIDNVKERRSHTLQQHPVFSAPGHAGRVSGGAGNFDTRSVGTTNPANTDAIANILQSLFRDPSLRPKTLFRDLQFISAFVPASILDKTERGKAFWDAGLAALNLKHDVCKTMVEVADEVVKVYTQTRSGGLDPSPSPNNNRPGSTASSSTAAEGPRISHSSPGQGDAASNPPTPPPLPLMTYSLADAARMVTITAKEGDPTAQRELAIFYLGNSELVERTTLPLSKPREVFKQAVMEKYGGASRSGLGSSGNNRYHSSATGGRGLGQGQASGGIGLGMGGGVGGAGTGPGSDGPGVGDVRSDPALMCLAIHWMKAAEHGGDDLARTFLGQNEIVGL